MQSIKTGTTRDTGGTGRKFSSFRELSEFLKREEDRGGYEGVATREESPRKAFASFRELSEHLKGEAVRVPEPDHAAGAELPGDFSHVSYHMHEFAPGDAQQSFSFAGNEGGSMAASKGKTKKPSPNAKKEENSKGGHLTNKTKTPIPYKPENSFTIKYCMPGEKCAVDGFYTPGGNKGKKKAIKIRDVCDATIHPDGKLETHGPLCVWPLTPRVVDKNYLSKKNWPNPYTGKNWPEEKWKDE